MKIINDHIMSAMRPCKVWVPTRKQFVRVTSIDFDRKVATGEDGIEYSVLENLVAQSIGLESESGTPIFEGDIVERFCPNPNCAISHRGYVALDRQSLEYRMFNAGGGSWPVNVSASKDRSIDAMIGVKVVTNIFECEDPMSVLSPAPITDESTPTD